MNIAIDISPLETGHFLQHRVRGTGFYLENLKNSLQRYFPADHYTFFTRSENLPNNIDLIHVPYFEPFFITLPASKKRTVVTVHDLTPLVFSSQFPSGLKGWIRWQIQKNRLKKASHIITDSESSRRDIVKYAGVNEDRVSVVYLAAGEEFKTIKVDNSVKKKFSLPEKFGLYVGDVTWNKNLPRIIKSFKALNLPLLLVGKAIKEGEFNPSNPWNKDLAQVRALIKDSNNTKALGFVSSEDLVSLYNLATVFVMPSLYEGFGLPVLEAMSCGCPVITSKSGSLEEVAGDAAIFVDPNNQSEIEEAVRKVFRNEKLRKDLSEKGVVNSERFTWQKTAEKTHNVYKSIIDFK